MLLTPCFIQQRDNVSNTKISPNLWRKNIDNPREKEKLDSDHERETTKKMSKW